MISFNGITLSKHIYDKSQRQTKNRGMSKTVTTTTTTQNNVTLEEKIVIITFPGQDVLLNK